MIKREIIKINEELCNGCGNCISGCSEGALQLIDGVAKLVKEDFCDGFGDCIGTCPTRALTIEERDAKAFNEEATKEHLLKTQGEDAVRKMEVAQKKHEHANTGDRPGPAQAHNHSMGGGCPGLKAFNFPKERASAKVESVANGAIKIQAIPSELTQWPVQLHLVNPRNEAFRDKELVVLSTCSPLASADIHWKYIRGRSVVVACPKLDKTGPYVEKLAEILKESSIPKVIVVRMEVPCCRGLTQIVKESAKLSEREDLVFEEHVVGIDGSVKDLVDVDYR